MKYSEGKIGRVFVLRMEDGDLMPSVIEDFAAEKDIKYGMVTFVGGLDDQSTIVVGPEDGKAKQPVPVLKKLDGAHEMPVSFLELVAVIMHLSKLANHSGKHRR